MYVGGLVIKHQVKTISVGALRISETCEFLNIRKSVTSNVCQDAILHTVSTLWFRHRVRQRISNDDVTTKKLLTRLVSPAVANVRLRKMYDHGKVT